MVEHKAQARADDSLRLMLSEHIDLVYDHHEKRVEIRVDGKEFLSCAALVASFDDLAKISKDITSIDELVEIHDDDSWIAGDEALRQQITPQEELIAHASNIQAWIENDYDPRILHSNIAFPLLRELARVGDEKARRVMEAAIDERMESGNSTTRKAIMLSFFDMLTSRQWNRLWSDPDPKVKAEAVWWGIPITPEILSTILDEWNPEIIHSLSSRIRKDTLSTFPPGSISPAHLFKLVEKIPWLAAQYHHLTLDQLRVLCRNECHVRQALARWIRGPPEIIETLLKDPDPITRELVKKNISKKR